VKRFPRRFEDGFQIDVEALRKNISPATRLIVITNLHNPSGVQTSESTLKQLGEIARSVNCRVLIDEVYLETMFKRRPRTAFHLGSEFVVTSSLTKAYGLSGLRCGWIIAEESLAKRMWLLNDLFASTPVHLGERLSVMALAQLEHIAEEADTLVQRNRQLVKQFLDSRNELEAVLPDEGTICFPRLLQGSVDEFVRLLRERYETSVVPGKFFEEPQHFRLGLSCDSEILAGGLVRLGAALNQMTS
jgi:aspartate/methionine/tyrosine aminotransferase